MATKEAWVVRITDSAAPTAGPMLALGTEDGTCNVPTPFASEERARRALGWSPFLGQVFKVHVPVDVELM